MPPNMFSLQSEKSLPSFALPSLISSARLHDPSCPIFFHIHTLRSRKMIRSTASIKPGQPPFILSLTSFSPFPKTSFTIASFPKAITLDSVESQPSDLLPRLLSILVRPGWQRDPSLKDIAPYIIPSHISELLNPPLDPKTALDFFNWISRRPGYRHDVRSHASLLNLLIPAQFLRVAEKIRISMIKSSSSVDDVIFVLGFLRNTNSDGKFKLSLRSYNTLLMSLSKFVLIDLMKGVFLDILNDGIAPNIYTYNSMINGYCKEGNIAEAGVYMSYMSRDGLDPDTHTYTSFILGHCRSNDIDRAYHVFLTMPQKGCRPNVVTYTVLIHGFCEHGRIDEALALFSKMAEDGCQPTVRTYTVLIAGLCGLGRRCEAFGLFGEMAEKGCEPNVHTYTVLIDSLCKDNKLEDAHKMLNEMSGKGLVANVVTYNALIDGYCKDRKIESAFAVLEAMEGSGCQPNARTYNELICGYCKEKKVHQAMMLFSKMLESSLSPSIITYNTLILGQCKVGHVDNAFRLLNLMAGSGLVADQWTYSMLIDALCKKGRIEDAHVLFYSLVEKKVKANEVIYTALIDGNCKVGNVDRAYLLLEKMACEGCSPNSCTYNALMDGLCKENKIKEATILLEKMVENGVEPTVVTYTILIDEMLKAGGSEHADQIFEKMVSSGCQPDVCIYTALIRAYLSERKLEKAEHLMAKMDIEGVQLDVEAYNTFIDGCGNLGLIDHAFAAFKRMIDAQCKPNHKTYYILIKHLFHENASIKTGCDMDAVSLADASCADAVDVWKVLKIDTTIKLLERMIEHGCTPNINTYDALIAGFCKEGRLEEAQFLVCHMRERGISPNEDVHISLVNCCCKLGMYKEALLMVDTMVECSHLLHLESYKQLICGLFDERNVEKAKTVFCSLLRCGYNYDEVAWAIFVDGLLKKGHGDGFSELLNIMEEKGCQPSPQTYDLLVKELDSESNRL